MDIHGAAAHDAVKEALEFPAHFVRVFPVVGGAGGVLGERTDEGAILDAGDIGGVRAGVVAAGPEVLVESRECAAFDHLLAEEVVFFLRAVTPMDGGGLGERGHFIDPVEQVNVLAEGNGGVAAERGGGRCHLCFYPLESPDAGWRVGPRLTA
jgi:hypothetical protein